MNSKIKSYILSLGIVLALVMGVVNFITISKLQKASEKHQKEVADKLSFLDAVMEQQRMMQALDSVKAEEGSVAQNFSLQDQNGNMVSLEDLEKQKALLVFSSALCDTCKDFYPHLNKFVKTNPQVSVVVLQIEASVEENKRMLEANKYEFRILEAGEALFAAYSVISTPTSILIDTSSQKILKVGDLFEYEDIVAFVK